MARLFEPGVSSKEMDSYAATLKLTPDQKAAADTLLEGYLQSFNTAAGSVRTKVETLRDEARETRDPAAWRDLGEEARKFRAQRDTMETAFFDDLKAVLTPDQLEKFPTIERARRRERTMGRGILSGERVDVVRLVESMNLDDHTKTDLNPTLEQYQAELDRELITRNQVYEDGMARARELMASGDTDEMQKVWEKGREAGARVRDVNRKYARQIEASLPEAERARFAESVRRESFPMIYRPSHAARVAEAAAAMPDLDETQKPAITTIRDQFTRELAALNKEMEAAWEKREQSITPGDMMRGNWMGDGQNEMEALRERRQDLENGTVEKVRALLKPEQVEKLPERGRDAGVGGPGDDDGPPRERRRRGEGRRDRQDAPERPETPAPGPI